MPNTNKRSVKISKRQAVFLRELVAEDMEVTDLSPAERQQAEGILLRLDEALVDWPDTPYRER